PWPGGWQQILLAAGSVGLPEGPNRLLRDCDRQLVQQLRSLHEETPPHPGQSLPGAEPKLEVLKKELAAALKEADDACARLREAEAKARPTAQRGVPCPRQSISVGALARAPVE
ncbi:unnamed protein product, partial [Effrenium voratum]